MSTPSINQVFPSASHSTVSRVSVNDIVPGSYVRGGEKKPVPAIREQNKERSFSRSGPDGGRGYDIGHGTANTLRSIFGGKARESRYVVAQRAQEAREAREATAIVQMLAYMAELQTVFPNEAQNAVLANGITERIGEGARGYIARLPGEVPESPNPSLMPARSTLSEVPSLISNGSVGTWL